MTQKKIFKLNDILSISKQAREIENTIDNYIEKHFHDDEINYNDPDLHRELDRLWNLLGEALNK